MKVQKLPAEVRSKLQSGVIVTDAVQCVLELVHNSLDAEATGIAVRIDLKAYQIRVIDNGKGIGKDDLEYVGERFMTSKYHSFNGMETSFPTYGHRGQALSSLQDVSRSLTIETKSDDKDPTFVKVFRNNKSLPITETSSGRSGTGTTVTIDDFMYTMPVRRKRISEVFDLEEIKNQLQYLAMIHYNVCFTLRNENKGLILLQTPQTSSLLELVSNIYGKSLAKSLKSLNFKEKKYEVTGFISIKPQTQHSLQLLYINKRIITKGVIHKFVNSLIKEYLGKKSLFWDSPTGQLVKQVKSSHNIFIIQIKCPSSYYELFTNVRKVTVEFKNWKDALKCVHRAIKRTFKDALNLDSSSNSLHQEAKNVPTNKKVRGAFGTSLLVNAVRGAPVKRGLKRQSTRCKKKTKITDKKEKSNNLLSKINKQLASKQFDNILTTNIQQNECTIDSLESPIPKKALKQTETNCELMCKKTNFNLSFVEFYEWLKSSFETDTKAFNLYNDFLKFKNGATFSPDLLQFKSPVLAVKPKRNRLQNSKKKVLEKKRKTSTRFPLPDEEMAVVTERHLNIFSNENLTMRKAVQFTSEKNHDDREIFQLDFIRAKNYSFERPSSHLCKESENYTDLKNIQRNLKQNEYSHTLTSLPSSEVQFTNIIKFRNLSESFFRQKSISHNEVFLDQASNTWISHYQNLTRDAELCGKKHNTENFVKGTKSNKNFDYSKAGLNLFEFIKTAVTRDAEIQADLVAKKTNAMVQTSQQVSETPSFESREETDIIATENDNPIYQAEGPENNQEYITEEVPNPDFWNTSAHVQFEAENQISKDNNDVIKNLTSNEFICGHKSQLSMNVESTSKETQTLAALWTDSLTEMGFLPENNERAKENTQVSEPTTISKTIPIEEIQCNIGQQTEQSDFCVTERHDFVPKGLSPEIFIPETTKISSVSPQEQCKIKLTIENAQNDLLANIKWQNESTGACLKPTIPDGIIFELRRKAGENVVNCENPVLSATLSYCAVKVHNLLHSFSFTKELLSGVEVLGQLDKKFIVTKMKISTPKKMELISLFDQHAVDERIKLEELINENISREEKFLSTCLNPPVECELTEFDVGVVSDLKEKMLNFGLKVQPISENTLLVNEIPTFLLKKHESDLKNKKEISLSDAVRTLILNIVEEMTETRGAVSKIPKIVHNAFCLEACHKAIRFNRSLPVERMREMINKLQTCKLPFQCAHGRPSVIPIIDLEDFKPLTENSEMVDLQKIKKFYNERKTDTVENSGN